jgi:acylphosphatase
MIRLRIHFFGNVQGVGFRYTACSVARGFKVTGFVRNRPNGSVELVVEGELSDLERFLASLRDRMGNHIDQEEIVTEEASGEFREFGIR